MRRVKLICKGVLLYVTIFTVLIFIGGIDSIYTEGYLIHSMITVAILIFLCYRYISEEEFKLLIFDKYFKVF